MEANQIETNNHSETQLRLQSEAEPLLKEAANWSKILAILGFIGIGILAIMAVFMIFAGGVTTFIPRKSALGGLGGSINILTGLFYLLLAVLYFFPYNYLYKFSSKVTTALRNRDTHILTQGFGNLKSYLKFMGIMTIVMVILFVLILIGIFFVVAISVGSFR